MADAFLQVLLDNLSSLIQGEIGLILGVDKETKKLKSVLATIKAVLADAEDKQQQSWSIRDWLRKLKDLAYEIDDLLNEYETEVSKMKENNNKLSWKKILFQRKIGRRMKEVAEKIDDVAAERQNFHLREMLIEKQTEITTRCAKRETGWVLNEPDHVYGTNEQADKIVDILVNHVKDCQQLSVLPLLGLGGLGKTTLAQLVYNDQRIKDHFEPCIWVCVSDDFDPKILIKAMIEYGTGKGSASNLTELDTLQRHLCKLLNRKRYLLILDDVWNENQEKWAMLKKVLTYGAGGASVVVTTRLRKVADIMGTLPAHCLMGLSDEHCWSVFKKCAFGHELKEYPNLEPIGRKIVKKCAGVPLAAKTLGGLLRFKRKEREWICVKESEIWDLPQEETSILPALRLSYLHLPLTLRRCFPYCALFPKDQIIKKEKLISRWIAHGCISSNRMQEVEEVGDEVWNELALRSLFQEVHVRDDGKTIFKMHDLLHDLALSILENKIPTPHANSNHLSASNSRIRKAWAYEEVRASPSSSCTHHDEIIQQLKSTNDGILGLKFFLSERMDKTNKRIDLLAVLMDKRSKRTKQKRKYAKSRFTEEGGKVKKAKVGDVAAQPSKPNLFMPLDWKKLSEFLKWYESGPDDKKVYGKMAMLGKPFFNTLLGEGQWLESDHIDEALCLMRIRQRNYPNFYDQEVAFVDCQFM